MVQLTTRCRQLSQVLGSIPGGKNHFGPRRAEMGQEFFGKVRINALLSILLIVIAAACSPP